MINVTFKTEQINALKGKLAGAREALKQDGVAMRQVAVFLDRWVQKNFQSSGGNVGGWEPFKYGGRLTTKAKGNAKSIDGHHWINGSAKLLMDSGALRLSFLPFIRLGIAGIGSELPYSKYHEEGGKNLPIRRELMEEADVSVDVQEILSNWVVVTMRSKLQ